MRPRPGAAGPAAERRPRARCSRRQAAGRRGDAARAPRGPWSASWTPGRTGWPPAGAAARHARGRAGAAARAGLVPAILAVLEGGRGLPRRSTPTLPRRRGGPHARRRWCSTHGRRRLRRSWPASRPRAADPAAGRASAPPALRHLHLRARPGGPRASWSAPRRWRTCSPTHRRRAVRGRPGARGRRARRPRSASTRPGTRCCGCSPGTRCTCWTRVTATPDAVVARTRPSRLGVLDLTPTYLGALVEARRVLDGPRCAVIVVGGEAGATRRCGAGAAACRGLHVLRPVRADRDDGGRLRLAAAPSGGAVPAGRRAHATCSTRRCGRCRPASSASCTSPGRPGPRLPRPARADRGAVRRRPVRPRRRRGCTAPATWSGGPPDGTLEFAGRADDQVKIRGFRVEPGEIEARCSADRRRVAGRGRCVRAGRPAGRLRRRRRRRTSGRRWRRGCRSTWCPSAFVVLDALPLTANGKLDRAALPAPDAARGRPVERARDARPRSALVRAVRRGARRAAGRRRRRLLRLGGHSLLATRLVAAAGARPCWASSCRSATCSRRRPSPRWPRASPTATPAAARPPLTGGRRGPTGCRCRSRSSGCGSSTSSTARPGRTTCRSRCG